MLHAAKLSAIPALWAALVFGFRSQGQESPAKRLAVQIKWIRVLDDLSKQRARRWPCAWALSNIGTHQSPRFPNLSKRLVRYDLPEFVI